MYPVYIKHNEILIHNYVSIECMEEEKVAVEEKYKYQKDTAERSWKNGKAIFGLI